MIYKVIQWIAWLDVYQRHSPFEASESKFCINSISRYTSKSFSNRKELEIFSASIRRSIEDLVIKEDVLPRYNRYLNVL